MLPLWPASKQKWAWDIVHLAQAERREEKQSYRLFMVDSLCTFRASLRCCRTLDRVLETTHSCIALGMGKLPQLII